ncbi:MAG: cytochrome c-type biogenesis protein [Acidobacteriota bacterium]
MFPEMGPVKHTREISNPVILEGAERPKDLFNEYRASLLVATGKVEEILRSTLRMTGASGRFIPRDTSACAVLTLGMTAIRIVGSFQAQGLPPGSPAQEDVVRVVGAPAGPRRSGDVLEQKSREVSSLLRCPVCQGLAISDSPSTMARDMKMQVHDLLAAGYSEEQIMRYFENSYGEFVRLKPSLRGMNWLVWFAPLLILLAGAAIVVGMARRHPARSVEGAAGAEGLIENDLEPYLRRVRELAYGRAEGVLPEEAAVTPASGPRT